KSVGFARRPPNHGAHPSAACGGSTHPAFRGADLGCEEPLMSIDDTNRKKVRPDRSSCRREASSDHAGACADEQAHCQRKWRFANALPATADLIVSMSNLRETLA